MARAVHTANVDAQRREVRRTVFPFQPAGDGFKAKMETHGFVHSDHPNTVYFGSMTVDITYHRNAGDADGRLSVVVYTPKEPITLKGDVFADHLEMETCS